MGMMKVCKKLLLTATICIFSICTFFLAFNIQSINSTYARTSSSSSVNESIFIRNPEFSTFYNSKIYFYDNFDKKIKSYDINNEVFDEKTISLSDYSIIDASSLENTFFFLVKQEENYLVLAINLENNISTKISLEENVLFTKISVQKLAVNESDHFIVSLNSVDENNKYCPYLMLLTLNYEKVSLAKIDFDITKENLEEIQNNLFKLIVVKSSKADEINLMFVYNNKVSYSEISTSSLSIEEILLTKSTILFDSFDSTNNDIDIGNVNYMNANGVDHLIVTYDEENESKTQTYSKLYQFVIGDSVTTNFVYRANIESANSNFVLTNQTYLIYPSNQTVIYKEIEYNTENDSYSSKTNEIKNPKIDVVYYEELGFVYKKTTSQTILTKTPWDNDAIVTLPENYDVINVGDGKIEKTNEIISDYIYCFVTINNTNYSGYISSANLTNKNIVNLEDYKYKVVKAVPNSNLYTAPTKVAGSYVTKDLISGTITQIKDNSKVKILDVICEYSANNTTFIKVQVNDSEIGYIDIANIIAPSETVDFVITNSSIQKDKTKVYQDTNTNSTVIGELKKGYRVRVNGKRNTKTGITCITYNDEYGNEFTGYIVTDELKTDSWSALQIIGCILIAINVGLLILILIFKKNHIGHNGNKYLKNEKENYKVEDNNAQ